MTREVAMAIQRLQELPPNWDSYGASRVASEAILTATRFIEYLSGGPYADPIVGPDVGGGVELIWEPAKTPFQIHFLVPPMGTCRALVLENDSVVSTEEVKAPYDLVVLLHRYYSP